MTFDETTSCQLHVHGNTDTTMEIPLYVVLFSVRREAHQKDIESFILKLEAVFSSETSILTRTTRHHDVQDDRFLHVLLIKNIKSYETGAFINLPNPSSRIRPWGLLSL
jgi:hypothetical protein